MLGPSPLLFTLLPLLPLLHAQETIYSAVVLSRVGQRTPLAQSLSVVQATSRGLAQSFAAGAFFRSRYLTSSNGTNSTLIQGLPRDLLDPSQLMILTLDTQYAAASAQAFLQALYPPVILNSTTPDPAHLYSQVNASGVSILQNPLGGYQYPQIASPSLDDPLSIYLASASSKCPAWRSSTNALQTTPSYTRTSHDAAPFYANISTVLADSKLPVEYFTYANAFHIYDYVLFQSLTSPTVAAALTNGTLPANTLPRLRALAESSEAAIYAPSLTNPSLASNATSLTNTTSLLHLPSPAPPLNTTSPTSIPTQALLSLLLAQLATTSSTTSTPLTLLFAEYPAFLSLAPFLPLPARLPTPGAALALELVGPDPATLSLRLLLLNASVPTLLSTTPWPAFLARAQAASLAPAALASPDADIAAWCAKCAAALSARFCLFANQTARDAVVDPAQRRGYVGLDGPGGGPVAPAAAGAIGAVAMLAVAVAAWGVWFVGWRRGWWRRGPGKGAGADAAAMWTGAGARRGRADDAGGWELPELEGPASTRRGSPGSGDGGSGRAVSVAERV